MQQPKVRKKKIKLPKDSVLNQKIVEELDKLFRLASPKTLLKSANYVFFMYLYYAKAEGYPSNFNYISEDFYFLQNFFVEVNEEIKSDIGKEQRL